MRFPILLSVVVAIGIAFSPTALGQVNDAGPVSQSVSVVFHAITESKTYRGEGLFNETVQDASATESVSSQLISSVTGPSVVSPGIDISTGGTVSFHITAPQDEVQTIAQCVVTFNLISPATFTLTENSAP
jgi:hypothetical protein